MLKLCLILLLLSVPWPASVLAEDKITDVCQPYRQDTDKTGLKDTKLPDNIPYGKGLLWKITAPDNKFIHLFGTMHSQDRLVTDIPPPVRLKLVKSGTFVMEVMLDESANQAFSEALYFEDDQRLDHLLQEEIYNELAEKISDYGIPPEMLPRLQPWAAFTLVGRPRPVNAPTQDIKLMQIALSANVDITALETMEELLSTLQGIPLSDQVEILNDTVCNHAEILQQARELVNLYINKDLAAIIRLNDEPHHDEEVFKRYIERMLYSRNERMLGKIEQYLEQGNAFIAVGASHLPGERGLLKMLEEMGNTVERIY